MSTNKKQIMILGIFSLLLILTSISNSYSMDMRPVKPILPNTTENWTVMLYFCADTREDYVTSNPSNQGNWLHLLMGETIEQLKSTDLLPGSESDINVIVLYDHPYDLNHPSGNAKIYEIQAGNRIELDELGPKNMGLSSTLEDFIDYCKLNYPANNYALALTDHGRGYAGFCYDYHGMHPSFSYALGDCLTVEETGDAIYNAGGVDVLFMDVCQGGSFEAMWQFSNSVHYCVAGESLQKGRTLCHSRDILYALSRDTSMTPLELATEGFDSAVDPIRVPSEPTAYTYAWPTVALYDLTKFSYVPITGGISFKSIFTNFVNELNTELNYNIAIGKKNFGNIRGNITYSSNLFKSGAMMVDLGHFVNDILFYTSQFHYSAEIETAALALANRLTVGAGNLIVNEFNRPYTNYVNMTGFSICFPNTGLMYQEYLYPNFYEDMDISLNTLWDEFIFTTFPVESLYYNVPIPEFFEVRLGPLDPSIGLHLFIKEDLVTDPPRHVGWIGGEVAIGEGSFMGIELGVEGVQFEDNLLFGTSTLIIPSSSLPALSKSNSNSFTIVVNASAAASASKAVNLTVKHVMNNEVVWEDTKIRDIDIGQSLTTEISIDEDEWSDFEVTNHDISTPGGFIGIEKSIPFITGGFTTVIVTLVIFRKKKR